MKIFLCIALYPENDPKMIHFRNYHSPRNQAYCKKHDFEYREITNVSDIPIECQQREIVWWRFYLIQKWMHELKDGDIIAQIDADICIVNGSKPFVSSKNFAYAIDSCNTHCMGAFTIRVSDWSKQMLTNLLDIKRHLKYKDTPFWKVFKEQACWYSLAGIKDTFADPKQIGWQYFDNLGWHSTKDNEPVYSLEELKENVEILPVEWNVTSWNDNNAYFKIPTRTPRKKDVIFRHFAGRKYWDAEWTQIMPI